MKKKGKYLGEILVNKGLISDSELQMVIQEQMRNKKFIGAMLIEKGLVSEKDLLDALAEQFGVESIRLKDVDIDWDATAKFSASMITDYKCLPIKMDEETVTLAIANPLDAWVVDKAEKEAAPCKLKVVLTTVSDMDEALKEYRRRSIRKTMKKWKKD
jgi:type IV pilus assembly protein PilB